MSTKLLLFFLGFLTLLKIVAIFTTSFDLFGDEAQYWLWSQALDLGYLSKPPLLAWTLFLHTSFLGSSFESVKLFPIVFYIFTTIAVYALCLSLKIKKTLALLCAFSFFVMPAVSVSSFLISTDVVLLFFWSLSLIMFLRIRNDPSLINFVVLGILLGLAFLSKYAAVYFFFCLLVNIIFDKKLKDIWKSNKLNFLIFVLVVIIVMLPNIYWNAANGWVTFDHTSDNANFKNINPDLLRGFSFLIIQAIMLGPILVLANIINIKKIFYDKENIFLLSFSLPIIVLVLFESILVRANANWAAPGLICLLVFLIRLLGETKLITLYLNFFVNLFFGFIFFIFVALSLNLKIFDRINGVRAFSNEINGFLVGKSTIVVSDRLLYSSLAYENKDKEIVFLMPLTPEQKISKHFQIDFSLDKKMADSFLLIGDASDIYYLTNDYKIVFLKEYHPKFLSSSLKVYEVSF